MNISPYEGVLEYQDIRSYVYRDILL